jgi:hypothetical protein
MEIVVTIKEDLTGQQVQDMIYLIDNMYGVENIHINIKAVKSNTEDMKGLPIVENEYCEDDIDCQECQEYGNCEMDKGE